MCQPELHLQRRASVLAHVVMQHSPNYIPATDRAHAATSGSFSSGGLPVKRRRVGAVRPQTERTSVIGWSGVFTSGDMKLRAKRRGRGADVVTFNGFTYNRRPMTAEERADFQAAKPLAS